MRPGRSRPRACTRCSWTCRLPTGTCLAAQDTRRQSLRTDGDFGRWLWHVPGAHGVQVSGVPMLAYPTSHGVQRTSATSDTSSTAPAKWNPSEMRRRSWHDIPNSVRSMASDIHVPSGQSGCVFFRTERKTDEPPHLRFARRLINRSPTVAEMGTKLFGFVSSAACESVHTQ